MRAGLHGFEPRWRRGQRLARFSFLARSSSPFSARRQSSRALPAWPRMGATTVEVKSSHVLMLSHPGVVLNVIRKATPAVQNP